MSTRSQLQATAKNGPFAVTNGPIPMPEAGQVVLKIHATAMNPINFKQHMLGLYVTSWPKILGSEASGTVISVGSGVTNFSPGSEVIATLGGNPDGGSFQTHVAVAATSVVPKPETLSFAEACGLSVAFLTGASAVYSHPQGLGLPLPFLESGDSVRHNDIKSVLVLGGSSGAGATAIQLIRQSLGNDGVVLATASSAHLARLTGDLGASEAFDRKSASLVEDIKAATKAIGGVDAILDTVGTLQADGNKILEVFRRDGPKLVVAVMTGPPAQVPEGITRVDSGSGYVYERPGGRDLLRYLKPLVDSGKFKVPFEVVKFGDKLEDIPKALDKLKSGVSGKKLVVEL